MAEISSSSSSSGMAATVAVGGGDCGTSPSALKKTKVWRVCIDMDSAIKRPYSPSIEVVTRPGEVLDDGRKREETEGKGFCCLNSLLFCSIKSVKFIWAHHYCESEFCGPVVLSSNSSSKGI